MEDHRAWALEECLWAGDPGRYRGLIDPACLMVVPVYPWIMTTKDALQSMLHAPRWTRISFSSGHVSRPAKGLIVLAYLAYALREEGKDYKDYIAHCTSTWRRHRHEDWRLVQHQQTPQISG
jgi:Domain of unknown function (DUF4440)